MACTFCATCDRWKERVLTIRCDIW